MVYRLGKVRSDTLRTVLERRLTYSLVRSIVQWASVPSSELVPGDLVSIQRKKGGDAKIPAPCDVLLLKGEAVINEAMLTGESTPMMKESIASREPHEQLNLASDRVHVVYGGTSIISHSPRGDEASAAASSSSGTAKATKAHHQVPAGTLRLVAQLSVTAVLHHWALNSITTQLPMAAASRMC